MPHRGERVDALFLLLFSGVLFGTHPSPVAGECRCLSGLRRHGFRSHARAFRRHASAKRKGNGTGAPVRAEPAAMADEVERLRGPGGEALCDLPGAFRPDAGTPAPSRLMAMWDSTPPAYADRARLIPPEYRPPVIRRNGDVLPALLVDGRVAGVRRPTAEGAEATAFHPLPAAVWDELAVEAKALAAFLGDRERVVHNRCHHWWAKLPDAATRML
ncbi:winged helix DNA-binding domain-containing protein [Streptomyces sp. 130]|uniref:winged helix DNA-binding domain-containing protein n=1 Tax=Streptomyces sp. 130 TaxID=2591006 RepID=UPI0021B0D0C5|nr:winged helix DNA-binding domain-containing protein [Streptomyces sp. 130]